MKTRSKMLKAQFVHAMTKNRYMGNHPRTKRFILGSFATLVIGYVGFNISLSVPEISVKWDRGPIILENPALALNMKPSEVVEVKELTIEEKIAKTFPENPTIMMAIAQAESGMNPLASHKNTNGSVDIGLFQINSIHGKDQLELFDVDHNIEVARQVYEKQGLGAWVAFSNGAYLKFVK